MKPGPEVNSANPGSSRRLDYQIFEGDMPVGRICQSVASGSTEWFWTLYGRVGGAPPECGFADSVEEAQAAFEAAWEQRQ
jgi:hypothetical protein